MILNMYMEKLVVLYMLQLNATYLKDFTSVKLNNGCFV